MFSVTTLLVLVTRKNPLSIPKRLFSSIADREWRLSSPLNDSSSKEAIAQFPALRLPVRQAVDSFATVLQCAPSFRLDGQNEGAEMRVYDLCLRTHSPPEAALSNDLNGKIIGSRPGRGLPITIPILASSASEEQQAQRAWPAEEPAHPVDADYLQAGRCAADGEPAYQVVAHTPRLWKR